MREESSWPKWQPFEPIAPGGDVLAISGGYDGSVWLATAAGLFAGRESEWRPVARGMPFSQVSAVLAASDTLLAGGANDSGPGLVRSADRGESWRQSWIDQVQAPLTCLLASPNYNQDRVLLAGTYGEGVLRSTDGGRNWQLSNFGLHDFGVLSLAALPVWDRREPAFAGTEAGLYRSPNAGRAWRLICPELKGVPVLALAAGRDGLVLAGTEARGLWRSADGGDTWQAVAAGILPSASVNCLLMLEDEEPAVVLAGTGDYGVLRSTDGGLSWRAAASEASPGEAAVLSLARGNGHLYAGLSSNGLLTSGDKGHSWRPVAGLTARRYTRLLAPAPKLLIASGPGEGPWVSEDGGAHWQAAPGWPAGERLLALAAAPAGKTVVLLAAAAEGLFRSADLGQTFASAAGPDSPIASLACSPDFERDGRAWAGTAGGKLWASADGGLSWQAQTAPPGASPLVAVAPSPHFASDHTLLAGAADPAGRRVELWRSFDEGATWDSWFSEEGNWLGLRLAPAGLRAAKTCFGLGLNFWHPTPQGWQSVEITTGEAPINAIVAPPGAALRIVSTVGGLLHTTRKNAQNWQTFDAGLEGAAPADIILSPGFAADRTVYLLTQEGTVWQRRV